MAKSQTTVQIRPDSSTPGITGSHAHMIERLKAIKPYKFDPRLQARPEQLELAGDIVRTSIMIFEQYLVALMRDIADHTYALRVDTKDIEDTLYDFRRDLGGQIDIAADTVREEGLYQGRAA